VSEEALRSVPTLRERTATLRVAEVAAQQWGVIDCGQLRDCGVSSSTVSRWCQAGRLHVIHRGVYALGHASIPVEGGLIAALLYAGPDAFLSHATAAWWWRVLDPEPPLIHVSVPGGRGGSVKGVRVHHPRTLQGARHRRLPVTTLPRTLLDFASVSSLHQVRRALAQADYLRLLEVEAVAEVCGQGRAGSTRLRRALERHDPRLAFTRSELEQRFLALCDAGGVALPEVNARVHGWTVDAFWRAERLIVELDGFDNHNSRAQIDRDRTKELRLREAGLAVTRYTWRQVTEEAAAVVTDLRRCLSSAELSASRGSR
jgi:predicted transcriptional regulator of viral defense system